MTATNTQNTPQTITESLTLARIYFEATIAHINSRWRIANVDRAHDDVDGVAYDTAVQAQNIARAAQLYINTVNTTFGTVEK